MGRDVTLVSLHEKSGSWNHYDLASFQALDQESWVSGDNKEAYKDQGTDQSHGGILSTKSSPLAVLPPLTVCGKKKERAVVPLLLLASKAFQKAASKSLTCTGTQSDR